MLLSDDIAEDARPIRRVTFDLQYPSDVWILPRYVKLSTRSTGLPSTTTFRRSGPESEPTDCSLVFGHEMWRPNTEEL